MAKRFIFALILLSLFTKPAPSQSASDTGAQSIVARMHVTANWTKESAIADVRARGTIERVDQEKETSAITITAKGTTKLRSEVSDGTVLTINGRVGELVSNGLRRRLVGPEARSMQPFFIPFLTGLAPSRISASTLKFLDVDLMDGEEAFKIRIEPVSGTATRSILLEDKISQITMWVSTKTLLPIAIEFEKYSVDSQKTGLTCLAKLGDYRVVDGMTIPFLYEESANGKVVYRLRFSEIAFNVGIQDSFFDLSNN